MNRQDFQWPTKLLKVKYGDQTENNPMHFSMESVENYIKHVFREGLSRSSKLRPESELNDKESLLTGEDLRAERGKGQGHVFWFGLSNKI